MKAKIIAHRGRHIRYHENTKDAFIEASKGCFYGIETDIHLTKDNIWITHHNETIVSGGKEYTIKELTLDEIMSLPLDNNKGINNATVCLFEDYLQICKDGGKRPIIEIKFSLEKEQAIYLINTVKKYFDIRNVTFISFYPKGLIRLRNLDKKNINVQLLVGEYEFLKHYAILKHVAIDIDYTKANEKLIKRFHRHHLEFNAWTINDEESAKKFDNWGADYITTDVFDQNSLENE